MEKKETIKLLKHIHTYLDEQDNKELKDAPKFLYNELLTVSASLTKFINKSKK